MPNYCLYRMKIKGTKENCYKWFEKMKTYEVPNHFYRMFDPIAVNEETGTENEYTMEFEGYCAWSLESCCRASGYSEGIDLFEVNTKDLNLTMEAYSQELGLGFEEHYMYDKGNCVIDEETTLTHLYWDKEKYPNFEDFKANNNVPDDLNEYSYDEYGQCIDTNPEWEFTI